MVSEYKVLGATLDSLDSFDSDPGPNLMNLMNLQCPKHTLDTGPPQAPPGPPHRVHRMSSSESHESKVGPKARTLDSVDASASTPGPMLMKLMKLKPAPRPGLEMHLGPLASSESEARASMGGLNRKFWVPLSIH